MEAKSIAYGREWLCKPAANAHVKPADSANANVTMRAHTAARELDCASGTWSNDTSNLLLISMTSARWFRPSR